MKLWHEIETECNNVCPTLSVITITDTLSVDSNEKSIVLQISDKLMKTFNFEESLVTKITQFLMFFCVFLILM